MRRLASAAAVASFLCVPGSAEGLPSFPIVVDYEFCWGAECGVLTRSSTWQINADGTMEDLTYATAGTWIADVPARTGIITYTASGAAWFGTWQYGQCVTGTMQSGSSSGQWNTTACSM